MYPVAISPSCTSFFSFYSSRTMTMNMGIIKRVLYFPFAVFFYYAYRIKIKDSRKKYLEYVKSQNDSASFANKFIGTLPEEERIELAYDRAEADKQPRGHGQNIPTAYKRVFYSDGNIENNEIR